MKLWLLRRADPDSWGYDEADGFVVRAKSAELARFYCVGHNGDEGDKFWLDPLKSSCIELLLSGDPGIIVRDFHAG